MWQPKLRSDGALNWLFVARRIGEEHRSRNRRRFGAPAAQLGSRHADADRVESPAQKDGRAALSETPLDGLLEDVLELVQRILADPFDIP